MAVAKEVAFKFVVDSNSLQQAKTALAELTSEATKLSAALKGSGGLGGNLGSIFGGGAVGANPRAAPTIAAGSVNSNMGGTTQALLANKNLFKGLADGSRDTLRVMTDALRTAIGSQKRELSDLERTIERLTRSYGNLKDEANAALANGVNPAGVMGFYGGQMSQTQQQLAGALGSRGNAQQQLAQLQGMMPNQNPYAAGAAALGVSPPPPGGFGGGGGTGGAGPFGGMSQFQRSQLQAAMITAVSGAVQGSLDLAQSAQNAPLIQGARSQSFARNILGEMRHGDFSTLAFMRMGDKGQGLIDRANRDWMGKASDFLGASGQVGSMAGQYLGMKGALGAGAAAGVGASAAGGGVANVGQIPGQAAGIASGFNGIGGNMLDVVSGGPQAQAVETAYQASQLVKQNNPVLAAAMEQLQQTAGARVGAAKLLQGNHIKAWGIGSGFGLDMGEAFSAGGQLVRQFGAGGAFGDTEKAMRYDRAGHWTGVGPAKFQGLMRNTLQLEGTGFDRGAAGATLGTLAAGEGRNVASSADKAYQRLEEVFAKGIGRGLKDARFYEEIGTEMARANNSAGGHLGGSGYGRLLTSGLDGGSSIFDVQNNALAAQKYDQTVGGNPYFQAIRAETAKNILGPSATGLQMMAVQRASMAQLVSEKSPELDSLGVNQEQRQRILNTEFKNLISTYAPKNGILAGSLRSGDFDVSSLLRGNPKAREEAAAMFHLSGTEGSYDQGMGLANLIGGFGDNGQVGRKSLAQHRDGLAEGTVAAQQRVMLELMGKEKTLREAYNAALEKSIDIQKKLGEAPAPGTDTLTQGQQLVVQIVGIATSPTSPRVGAKK